VEGFYFGVCTHPAGYRPIPTLSVPEFVANFDSMNAWQAGATGPKIVFYFEAFDEARKGAETDGDFGTQLAWRHAMRCAEQQQLAPRLYRATKFRSNFCALK